MNELEADELKEEAGKYAGSIVCYKQKNVLNGNWEDVSYRYTGEYVVYENPESITGENGKVSQTGELKFQIWAKLVNVNNEKIFITRPLKSVVQQLKNKG